MDWSKDGVTLHYEKSGQGYPVVLLHGWGCSSESFHAIAQHLAPSFTVYNLDLPGFGQSTPPLGVNLFVSCGIAKISIEENARAMVKFLIANIIALLLITYIEPISLTIPKLMGLM